MSSFPGVPFQRFQARQLLRDKYVLIIGDSVQRGVYKDLVALIHDSEMLRTEELVKAGELNFRGDRKLYGTQKNLGHRYMEIREYVGYNDLGENWRERVLVRFVFVTKIWDNDMKELLNSLTDDQFPDVLLVNSLFWDVTKYGHQKADKIKINECWTFPKFEHNLEQFINHVDQLDRRRLEKSPNEKPCLKLWRSTMPIR